MWIRASVHSAGVPRCPGGCMQKLPFRLPARSRTLKSAIEQLAPRRLEQRQEEVDADADAAEEECLGGFRAWQEVQANRDVIFGSNLGVRQGTPGIIVGNFTDGLHVTVKFDEREDASELCVNVLPDALMAPLPGGFRLGQRVVALYDLLLNGQIGIRLGTAGLVVGSLKERLMVLFDERVDSGSGCEGPVSVSFREVTAQRVLVGGFSIAQKVQSAMGLIVGNKVVVPPGTPGTVLAEFSDTRLTVGFQPQKDAAPSCFNVLPLEIRPWCEPPSHLPISARVKVTQDILSMNTVIIACGTQGTVLGGIDEKHVFILFDIGETGTCSHAIPVECRLVTRLTLEDGPQPGCAEQWQAPGTSMETADEDVEASGLNLASLPQFVKNIVLAD